MIPTDGVYIELRSDNPERLAAFYERLVGMQRAPGAGILLTGMGVTLSIKPAIDEPVEEGGTVFGFRAPDGSDPASLRNAAVEAGAVLLSESKREGLATLSCQDPDGNPFLIVAVLPSVGIESAPVRVVTPPSVVPPAPASQKATPPPVASPRGPIPAGNRPTRRDVDRLRDMDRLASMAESIAGLDMAFTEDDPAHVMDRMRSKIPVVSEAELRVREADAEMRAREKQSAVDDMLSQYRSQVSGEPAPAASTKPETPTAPSAPSTVGSTPVSMINDPVLADLDAPHTLGPSTANAGDEPDPLQAEAPRTLGRSTAYDEDDEKP